MKQWWVYIATNKRHGVLYIEKTHDVRIRSWQHASGKGAAFTKKYRCDNVVYVESYKTHYEATQREKQLKYWKREWKIVLIESQNPTWSNYRM